MAANIRCIMRAKAPYGQGITKMKVKLTPSQSSTPSLMPETNSVYLTRPTEGTGELMELVGGSVAWNQLRASMATRTDFDGITTSYDSTTHKFKVENLSRTANYQSGSTRYSFTPSDSIIAGHKILLLASSDKNITGIGCYRTANNGAVPSTPVFYSANSIFVADNDGVLCLRIDKTYDFETVHPVGDVTEFYMNAVDLTQMLGSAIADYVYSLEQATAGSGVQWLKSYGFFTEDYIPYSAPTLQSVEATSHVTKDANDTVIATYPLDNITLRGIPKLSNGNLYYDGDTYEWDGTVNRRFTEVDLGSLTWYYNSANAYFYAKLTEAKGVPNAGTAANMICDKYINHEWTGLSDKQISRFYASQDGINVKDSSYTDAATFKTAMSGHYLVFELADAYQTTESADPFTAVQTVEDGGTEEFVTTNGVPVGVVGRFANAVPMEGVDSFTVTANDGTSHTYPVTLSEEIYRGYVDMLTGEAVSDMASIAEYNGETINSPWLSSLDVYALGATPTRGAQVVYPITPEEVTATITGDPSELSGVVSATSTEGTVNWSELSEIGIKCIMKRKNPFQ